MIGAGGVGAVAFSGLFYFKQIVSMTAFSQVGNPFRFAVRSSLCCEMKQETSEEVGSRFPRGGGRAFPLLGKRGSEAHKGSPETVTRGLPRPRHLPAPGWTGGQPAGLHLRPWENSEKRRFIIVSFNPKPKIHLV